MTDEEFKIFLREATEEFRRKQGALSSEYGIGRFPRYWYDLEAEKLQFLTPDGDVSLEADIVDIGSYASGPGTWKWAWSNDSVPSRIRAKSEILKDLESITGFAIFGDADAFEVDEPMAWELAVLAVKHLGASGCYRAPSSKGLQVFLAIMKVKPICH